MQPHLTPAQMLRSLCAASPAACDAVAAADPLPAFLPLLVGAHCASHHTALGRERKLHVVIANVTDIRSNPNLAHQHLINTLLLPLMLQYYAGHVSPVWRCKTAAASASRDDL